VKGSVTGFEKSLFKYLVRDWLKCWITRYVRALDEGLSDIG
jgi:hypothetical protein